MIIAYDLGTGGLKASLHRDDGRIAASAFVPYDTFYPAGGTAGSFQEQRPLDWWDAVCGATRTLLADSGAPAKAIAAVALSGQSLAPVLLDGGGSLLLDAVPIWSDTRATAEAAEFFEKVPYRDWYMTTGNGDPPETYTLFKLMWLKKHRPEAYGKAAVVLGSKDYINFRLTGRAATDYSYASGCGAFDLLGLHYRPDYLAAAGVDAALLPEVGESHAVVGHVTARAAAESGLPAGIPVGCGGVDNACMALGALGVGDGRVYTSLGSSSWIAATSKTPTLDPDSLPFIFAHIEKGYYTSGVSIFAAGRSYRWAAEQLCNDLPTGGARFAAMDKEAAASPPGAGGLLFYPALSGGSSQEPAPELRGAFIGAGLATTRGDMLRAVLEGVALTLDRYCLAALRRHASLGGEMLLCGGGAKSPLWNQIFADVFGMDVVRTGAEENAASLGAAAIAARAAGLWKDYAPLDGLYPETERFAPAPGRNALYQKLGQVYTRWTESMVPACRALQEITDVGGTET